MAGGFTNQYIFRDEYVDAVVERLTDRKSVAARTTMELMKHDGFRTVVMRENVKRKDSRVTLYVKCETELLQNQVKICRKDNITFRPALENASSEIP